MAKPNRPQNKNLKRPTSAEAREIGRKGGIASGKSRAKKKLMKEVANDLLTSKPHKNIVEKFKRAFDIDADDNQTIMLLAIFKKAIQGDVKAFEVLRDTAGQKPSENNGVGEIYGTIIFSGEEDIK